MPTIQPYLMFNGRCDEALEFYRKAIGAKTGMIMRFNESPDAVPEGMLQPGFEKKIMHSEFTVGDSTIMASDGCDDKSPAFGGFALALNVATEADADRLFNPLTEGGKVLMPLSKTFWSPRFGMVVDKFGVQWMISVPMPR